MPPARPRAPVDESSRSETSSIQTTKDRQHSGTNAISGSHSKGKRTANHTNGISSSNSHSKTSAALAATPSSIASGAAVSSILDPEGPRITWSSIPISLLHTYRHTYRLSTPSAYTNPHAHHILSHGIGARSPSSVSAKRSSSATSSSRHNSNSQGNRITKPSSSASKPTPGKVPSDQLASTVRKHFNNLAVSEGDVLSRFRYVVRMGGLMESADVVLDGAGMPMGPTGVGSSQGERVFRLRFSP